MSRDMVDFLQQDNKVEAGDVFKAAMSTKVGDALELKRKEVSRTLVGQQNKEEESAEV